MTLGHPGVESRAEGSWGGGTELVGDVLATPGNATEAGQGPGSKAGSMHTLCAYLSQKSSRLVWPWTPSVGGRGDTWGLSSLPQQEGQQVQAGASGSLSLESLPPCPGQGPECQGGG